MPGTRSSARIKAHQGRIPKRIDTPLTTNGAQRTNSSDSSSRTATSSKSTRTLVQAHKRRKTSHTSPHDTEKKKPAKRTSKAKPVTLDAVADLPLDILYEIFKHVHPADLLHLIQANKDLRYTLLCPGAKGVWEHLFRTVDDPRIPPCLDNKLSLPQYANLIYGEGCFVRAVNSLRVSLRRL